MAKLPPRAPTMAAANDPASWQDLQPPPTTTGLNEPNNGFNNPSWIDDFVEFSSSKRKAHRRSISDSEALLENPTNVSDATELDEEEERLIMYMFNNDLKETEAPNGMPVGSLSGPATSSGNGSSNANKRCRKEKVVVATKSEHDEVESCTFKINEDDDHRAPMTEEGPTVAEPLPATGFHETFVDPKRVKRILANRQSARRSRVRKLQYISELERNLTTLQTEVSMLSPRVAYLDHQRMILNADNSALKSQIAALVQDKIFKDAHQEALKREIERLKQVYQQQQSNDNILSKTPISSPPSSVAPSQAP